MLYKPVNTRIPAGTKGFWIGANGEMKAEEATISGKITATSGTFHGRIEAEDGWFSGELDCGDLQVRIYPDSMQRFPAVGNYVAGTTVLSIRAAVHNFLGIAVNLSRTYLVDAGVINGKNIRTVEFSGDIIDIRTIDNSRYTYTTSIDLPFWFQIGTGGKKVRFANLPNSAGAAPSGTLYMAQIPNTSHWAVCIKQ